VAQLFDATAVESGALRLQLNYFDLVAVLTQAASVSAPLQAVFLDLPPSCTVWGDRDRIEQVFVNLVSNALHHNPDDTKVTIRLVPVSEGDETVRVEVSDDGLGLPPEARAYLNGETAEQANEEGLGLRLVRGLVAAHHGSVRASVDGGTTVEVELPMDRIEES
jgi:signal transduction histidine kinase